MGFFKALFNNKASITYLADDIIQQFNSINQVINLCGGGVDSRNIDLIIKTIKVIEQGRRSLEISVDSLDGYEQLNLDLKWLDNRIYSYMVWDIFVVGELERLKQIVNQYKKTYY